MKPTPTPKKQQHKSAVRDPRLQGFEYDLKFWSSTDVKDWYQGMSRVARKAKNLF